MAWDCWIDFSCTADLELQFLSQKLVESCGETCERHLRNAGRIIRYAFHTIMIPLQTGEKFDQITKTLVGLCDCVNKPRKGPPITHIYTLEAMDNLAELSL